MTFVQKIKRNHKNFGMTQSGRIILREARQFKNEKVYILHKSGCCHNGTMGVVKDVRLPNEADLKFNPNIVFVIDLVSPKLKQGLYIFDDTEIFVEA